MINAKKKYSQYDNEVIAYMKNLIKALTKQYGQIEDEWCVSLDLIAFNYDVIVKCRNDIQENGFEKLDERGRLSRNPSLTTLNQAQCYLMKLLSQFGLNIMSKSKLKDIETTDTTLDELLA